MENIQLKAYIVYLLETSDISYMYELRKLFKTNGRFDLLLVLENDKDFSFKIKNFLFKRRLGVKSYV